jgi:hypothetical protein
VLTDQYMVVLAEEVLGTETCGGRLYRCPDTRSSLALDYI